MSLEVRASFVTTSQECVQISCIKTNLTKLFVQPNIVPADVWRVALHIDLKVH
jgi:hypothetical protein